MRIAAITMVYNEGRMLPLWLAYYGRHIGPENLYVVDHGSDDGSTAGVVNRIRLPRDGGYDEVDRCNFVAELHAALLRFFDVVIYTDCDEIIVPDPAKHRGLRAYIEAREPLARPVAPAGVNLYQRLGCEARLDFAVPILAQRRHCFFHSPLCKPTVAAARTEWTAGFHGMRGAFDVDPDLVMFHLKFADLGRSLGRVALTRDMAWTARTIEAGYGSNWRESEDQVRGTFDRWSALEPAPFELAPLVARAQPAEPPPAGGVHRLANLQGPPMIVPERFRAAF
jgi:hypothetical protein